MNHEKNKPYDALDRRLKAYADNSINAIPIDEAAKNKIWNNLNHEIHEHTMKRHYRVRKTYRLAFIISIVLVLIVSLDVGSKASLFRRLLTSVSEGTLQFYSRGNVGDDITYDEELFNKIDALNEEMGTEFKCPMALGTYTIDRFDAKDNLLIMEFVDDTGRRLEVNQKYFDESYESIKTNITYNTDFFEKELMHDSGIEYHIFKSEAFTVGVYTVGNIEVQVTGPDHIEVKEVILNMK